jgi:hypothetical protein
MALVPRRALYDVGPDYLVMEYVEGECGGKRSNRAGAVAGAICFGMKIHLRHCHFPASEIRKEPLTSMAE